MNYQTFTKQIRKSLQELWKIISFIKKQLQASVSADIFYGPGGSATIKLYLRRTLVR